MQISRSWATPASMTLGVCCLVTFTGHHHARAQEGTQAGTQDAPLPVYRVDPSWPKMPLPNKWLIQGVPVMVTDHNDHIWVVSRPRDITPDEAGASTTPPRTDCCIAAPAVLEFDPQGTLLNAWGGPGYHPGWPAPGVARPGPSAEHAIAVDKDGNVWLTGTGRGDGLQKFTKDGKFLWDFGHRGPQPVPGQPLEPIVENNQQTDVFPTGISQFTLDEDAREIYIAHWKRVLVYDMDTGAFKRGWGGKGMPLSQISNEATPPYDWKAGPPPDQDQLSSDLHCIHLSVDGLVYVCDRDLNRIHVFTKQGKFVMNFLVASATIARGPECGGPGHPTLGMCGSTYNIVFSHDAGQKYVLTADGTNHRIWIHDRRTGAYAGQIGSPGRNAGQFHWIDGIAMDSLGNIYTGEVDDGKRVQKFVLVNGDGVRRPRPHD